MLDVDKWTAIRCMAAQGSGIRLIARTLKVHRKTVRLTLRNQGKPRYQRPPRPNPELERLRPVITEWVFEKHLIGSVVLERLREAGGGYTYLARLPRCIAFWSDCGQSGMSMNPMRWSGLRPSPGSKASSTGLPTRCALVTKWSASRSMI